MKRKSIKNKLIRFKEEASSCNICRKAGLLYQHSNRRWAYPLFDNNLECRSGVLAIALAPNFDDTFDPEKGYLSYDIDTDPTGNFFRELLESVGLVVQDVSITNSVLCLPAGKDGDYPVYAAQGINCSPWINRLIDEIDPKVVVTLGAQALKAIKRIEKHDFKLMSNVGKLHNWYGRKLLPLYHTSNRGRANRPAEMQKRDISVLRNVLQLPVASKIPAQIQKVKVATSSKLIRGQTMTTKSFQIFKEQQELFRKALTDYDSTIWFPNLRGNFKLDKPSNWFISFVPGSWGYWKKSSYGVHFDFMYARPKKGVSERFRLAIGVEKPIKDSFKQRFKEEVLSKLNKQGVDTKGLILKAKDRTKLIETEFIPFGDRSWEMALERYVSLKPVVNIIGELVQRYYSDGAFDVSMGFR